MNDDRRPRSLAVLDTPTRFLLDLQQQDIDAANTRRGSYGFDASRHCPIAQAISRQLGIQRTSIHVGDIYARVGQHYYTISGVAQKTIRAWDKYRAVKPHRFVMVPE